MSQTDTSTQHIIDIAVTMSQVAKAEGEQIEPEDLLSGIDYFLCEASRLLTTEAILSLTPSQWAVIISHTNANGLAAAEVLSMLLQTGIGQAPQAIRDFAASRPPIRLPERNPSLPRSRLRLVK
ncbi:hypothetical protein A8C75_06770 [Marinobacterium aestuarii]|uniref:Uncharacterized protein n=1 Tax=Marinobacterium aestuarii TaxID=1821621 RepID=A0A1A9EXG7_9GAMM|nr:hypothetical protein [Marinobacterium aestuarii]ANG62223.1 hypothetical protein A8C75_06770 [Marinobacterium aestuarii]